MDPILTSCFRLLAGIKERRSGLIKIKGVLALLGCLGSTAASDLWAQSVPKAVLVEHFTNTLCSICASRNPGFYGNLRQQPNVLHIAYHPSSPYRGCQFSQQNPTENDARTNFYGVYGGTPRLVINGSVVPATQDYSSPALFGPFQSQTSPFAATVMLRAVGPDSISATVRVVTQGTPASSALRLYLALVQDTVNYAAPNGEQRHYDVFRKSFTGLNAVAFFPAAAGGTVVLTRTLYKNPGWVANRLYAVAVVQEASGAVLQAAASQRLGVALGSMAPFAAGPALRLYPNPATGLLFLDLDADNSVVVTLYDALGQIVRQSATAGKQVPVPVGDLRAGHYFVRVMTARGVVHMARFIKE